MSYKIALLEINEVIIIGSFVAVLRHCKGLARYFCILLFVAGLPYNRSFYAIRVSIFNIKIASIYLCVVCLFILLFDQTKCVGLSYL